ncbi:MAG: flagellar FlbD family protein [Deltaproteobacteria bacterium]|nr:flagellar FlbD family protein [Deltaproteobacteria bacterium]
MLKLTRLNNHIIAINPDHICWVEETPDTTLSLVNGEKLLVRESLDDLIKAIVEFRRLVRMVEPDGAPLGPVEGDPPRIGLYSTRRLSDNARRVSLPSPRHGEDR